MAQFIQTKNGRYINLHHVRSIIWSPTQECFIVETDMGLSHHLIGTEAELEEHLFGTTIVPASGAPRYLRSYLYDNLTCRVYWSRHEIIAWKVGQDASFSMRAIVACEEAHLGVSDNEIQVIEDCGGFRNSERDYPTSAMLVADICKVFGVTPEKILPAANAPDES